MKKKSKNKNRLEAARQALEQARGANQFRGRAHFFQTKSEVHLEAPEGFVRIHIGATTGDTYHEYCGNHIVQSVDETLEDFMKAAIDLARGKKQYIRTEMLNVTYK